MSAKTLGLAFVDFCERVLRVRLTRAQRVVALVGICGIEPRDLTGKEREIAAQLFGPVETIADKARAVLVIVKGARIGGTYIFAGLYSLWRMLTADLSGLAEGEQATALVVAPDLRLARQALRYALGAAKSVPAIAALLVGETSDSFTLRRPDGAAVAFECLPATRGGSALRGRTLVCAVLSEVAFFRDESAVVNDADCFRAVAPRVLPGGLVILESTPWAEAGLLYDEFQRNHGHPETAIAAHAPTILMRPTLRALVERERLRDPQNALREFDAEFLSLLAGVWFAAKAIRDSVDEKSPYPLRTRGRCRRAFCADLGFVRNSSVGCIIVEGETPGRYALAEMLELCPRPNAPLKPSEVCLELMLMADRHQMGPEYGGGLLADGHYLETLREHCPPGFLFELPSGPNGKEQQFVAARSVLHEGRLTLPNNPRLLQQLREVVVRPKPGGGVSIKSPLKRDGSHGDLVSALVGALWALEAARNHPAPPRADYAHIHRVLNGECAIDD